jgi:hypothetical protein
MSPWMQVSRGIYKVMDEDTKWYWVDQDEPAPGATAAQCHRHNSRCGKARIQNTVRFKHQLIVLGRLQSVGHS